MLLGLILGIAGCSYVIDRARTVDKAEVQVLEDLARELSEAAALTIVEIDATDRSPCWWWCEDYQLVVRVSAEAAVPEDRSLDEVCDSAIAAFSNILGPPTSTDPGRSQYRVCVGYWWDVEYSDRLVSIGLDVVAEESPSGEHIDLELENQTSKRAFLP